MRVLRGLLLIVGLCVTGQWVHAEGNHTVLTSLQATYSIAAALAEGTSLRLLTVPPEATVMESQAFALSRLPEAIFREAEAVVTLSKLWREDPLFPLARSRNVRIVNIDATFSLSGVGPAVSVIRRPVTDVPWEPAIEGDPGLSRYIWLSPTNATRMAELIAADFSRLVPADEQRIGANLAAFTQSMRELKADYGGRFARLADARVFSLAEEFVYLYSELGVFVDGWFIKQDINWTQADYDALTAYLKDHELHVVVHRWQPDAKVTAAIAAAGAKIAILDVGDIGPSAKGGALSQRGYQELMKTNMETLLEALSPQHR